MKKIIVLVSVLALSGCSTQQIDRAICYGNGTCESTGRLSDTRSLPHAKDSLPQTVITNNGTYLITRNQSGSVVSIIQTSRGK